MSVLSPCLWSHLDETEAKQYLSSTFVLQFLEVRQYRSNWKVIKLVKPEQCGGLTVCFYVLSKLFVIL